MPVTPIVAQPDASRRSGAGSHGPLTPEGKAAGNRHGVFSARANLSAEEEKHFQRLLADLAARHGPDGSLEAHWLERMALAMLSQGRADALEQLVVEAALAGPQAAPATGLPSPATLLRYRARLERNLVQARSELEALQAARREAAGAPVAAEPDRPSSALPDAAGKGSPGLALVATSEPAAAGDTTRPGLSATHRDRARRRGEGPRQR